MNLHDAIYKLNSNIVTIHDNVAYDANNHVVQYDVNAAHALVANNAYKVSRSQAYPSITDQLDMLWHAINNGENLKDSQWFNSIKEVKEKYPKPEGEPPVKE